MITAGNTKEKTTKQVISDNDEKCDLVLYNDDVHTFDYVIKALMRICGHSSVQAEQSAYIVHNNGKCSVKHGSKAKLKPMCTALLDRGLTAEVK